MKELVVRDEIFEQQEELLVQEALEAWKAILKLEKEKNEIVELELAQSKKTISSLKNSSDALQDWYDILQKNHKNLEVQFDAFWSSTSSSSSELKTIKAFTSNGCGRWYHIVDINVYVSHEKTIDSLKSMVKSFEAKVQENKKSSDNGKVEYARGEYLNTRMSHVKSGIGYKGDKHNSRVNNNDK
jgi:hypothetical protein